MWSQDASDDLVDIISFIKEKSGKNIASEIFTSIIAHVEKIMISPKIGRIVPELISIDIQDIREIIEKPWRIFYRVAINEIQIISVIVGRRNVEELLYKKVTDGKLE